MLHEFLSTNRAEIIERTRGRVVMRSAPGGAQLRSGIPLFLDQLIHVLQDPAAAGGFERIAVSAAKHGCQQIAGGHTISNVVRDYGDLCQSITEMADDHGAAITADEFHTFNMCLDDAIAEAVSEYARVREAARDEAETERTGALAHELRNRLNGAMMAFSAIKSGRVAIGGSTGHVLWRNLRGLSDLVTQAMSQVRLEEGTTEVRERISLARLVEDVEVEASLDAEDRKMSLTVAPVPGEVVVEGDPALLTAAVINLLQNAFKFTHSEGHVSLTTSATAERVVLEIEDECGGLPGGAAEDLFQPYTQRGGNKRGLGLGLTISRRAVETFGGELRVRDLPGRGCVFTIDLPRSV